MKPFMRSRISIAATSPSNSSGVCYHCRVVGWWVVVKLVATHYWKIYNIHLSFTGLLWQHLGGGSYFTVIFIRSVEWEMLFKLNNIFGEKKITTLFLKFLKWELGIFYLHSMLPQYMALSVLWITFEKYLKLSWKAIGYIYDNNFFLDQKFFRTQYFSWNLIFFRTEILRNKFFFSTQIFFNHNLFGPKFFFGPKIFGRLKIF